MKIEIKIDGNITNDQRQELLDQADNCYIHMLLNSDWNIESKRILEQVPVS